jgi:hypothetical protein
MGTVIAGRGKLRQEIGELVPIGDPGTPIGNG